MNDDRYGKQVDEGGYSQNCSLRDYFAGQVLAGIVSNMQSDDIVRISDGIMGGRHLVGASYRLADAMLEARKK